MKIGDDLVEIEKQTETLSENPDDEEAKAELEKTLRSVEGRNLAAPSLIKVAQGRAAVGDTLQAIRLVRKALRENPQDPVALNLMRRLQR